MNTPTNAEPPGPERTENQPAVHTTTIGGNQNAPPTSSARPMAPVPKPGKRRSGKVALAFFLGVLSFFLMFLLGEGAGDYALFIGLGAYFLFSQYLLSRGNSRATRTDWPVIVALNFTPVCTAVIALAAEPKKSAGLVAFGVALLALVCSYAGAALAARTARRSTRETTP